MKPKEFLDQIDDARVTAAIGDAELRSSGEIRVYVSHRAEENAMAEARSRFLKMGMAKTRERNGVLIYFAPASQQFAVVGDTGIHAKCGPDFWTDVATKMEPLLKAGRFTDAVVAGVTEVGSALARYFPRQGGDQNELSNEVVRGS